jgi:hypothetical protein
LKEENKALQAELTKCKDTLTELNTKLTDTESEKSNLLTVIRLLNEEQAAVICQSNKDESSQAQTTRSSWRMAGLKTTSQRVGHHISLSNKYSTLQIEDDDVDEAVMSSDASRSRKKKIDRRNTSKEHSVKIKAIETKAVQTESGKQQRRTYPGKINLDESKSKHPNTVIVCDSILKHLNPRKLQH